MSAHHFVGQPLDRSAEDPRVARALPADLLRDASRRLSVIALLSGSMWVIASLLDHVLVQRAHDPAWRRFQTADAIALVSAIVSFALFLYARKSSRAPEFILDLGHSFLVFTAFALGLIWHWAPITQAEMLIAETPMVSWIGALVLLFAATVPSTRSKILITSLIAVSMNPLGMAIAKARGAWDYGSAGDLLLMHFPDYLLVSAAVVISHVVSQLGQQVSQARELGSYRVGEVIGQGGMGVVYRARHRMLARPAAIKLIRPEMLAGGNGTERELALKRFRREAEVAASLRSPHTVELYDFGVTEDETLYFVMEELDGMTLDALVRKHGPVPANRVIHILRQVCESLEEAHSRGLVHRDIKPANIHIGSLGVSHDFVKVLDFGLVKSVGGQPSDNSLVTEIGMTPGTPAYMAPEVGLGESYDGRADLYALGCVAYFLLSGHLVFEAPNVFQVIAGHLNDAPQPVSRRTDRPVPPALEQVVMACLAKRAVDRPQSAGELSASLAAIDVEPWTESEAARWWKEREGRVS
jgi:tRNA A-37 threonylcarbamoyl transferase component Bud32